MKKYVVEAILIFLVSCSNNKVCRNPEGEEVDWYAIFFMPSSISSDKQIHYEYFDNSLTSLKDYKYSENNFPPNQITEYVTSGGRDINYFFWNDDTTLKDGKATNAATSKAHAKGSLVYDSDNGAFLLHSLPRFPTRDSNNEIFTELPSNGGSYGQTFLCITVNKQTAEQIAKLLNCVNVSINKSVDSDRINSESNTWINALIKNKMDSSCSIEHTVKIKSKGNQVFTFYGKNYKNKIIPYDTTLREAYNDDVYVRTWSRPSLAPALYDTFSLVNILTVKFDNYQYDVNKEHSKWAITKNKNIVCFSDLNHTESQKERGGHIVCFENKNLHSIMKNSIITTDETSLLNVNPLVEKFRNRIKHLL